MSDYTQGLIQMGAEQMERDRKRIKALEAENRRLRHALEDIREMTSDNHDADMDEDGKYCNPSIELEVYSRVTQTLEDGF